MLEHIKLKMEQNQPRKYGHKYNSVERILYKWQIQVGVWILCE